MKHFTFSAMVALCSLLVGCTAHYPANEPFSPFVDVAAGPSQPKAAETRSDFLLVGLATAEDFRRNNELFENLSPQTKGLVKKLAGM